MNKKIYFAGSIRGGRDDAALYKRMIDYMKRTSVVLTEHIGKSNMSLKAQTKAVDTHKRAGYGMASRVRHGDSRMYMSIAWRWL